MQYVDVKALLKVVILTTCIVSIMGCTTSTPYGQCTGIIGKEKLGLEYKVSVWNLFLAIVFSETIIVPIIVIADNFKCPVQRSE